MIREGVAIVLSAPSGAGKSTLCSMLLKEFPNLSYSVSCATRAPRAGEIDGKDYYFVSREEFERKIAAGEFAEYAEVHGNLYGTPLAPTRAALASGRDLLFDVDVRGAAAIRAAFSRARLAFILPPSLAELESRLRRRALDDEESIRKRLRDAADELSEALWYDALIVNDNLDEAYATLKAFYLTATLSPACRGRFLNQLLQEANQDGKSYRRP